MPTLSLTIPANAGVPNELRQRLDRWLRLLDADEASRCDIVLAAWEACVNAMEHAGSSEPIRVHAYAKDSGVCIRIEDSGRWLERRGASRGTRGHGLTIMRKLMHRVEIDRRNDGTSLLLCRNLARAT